MHYKYFFYILNVFLFALFYFITARFGLSIDAVSNFATLVWIPSGIAFAAMYLFGYKYFPGVFLGAFLVNLLTGAAPLVAIGIGIGNTLEALVGVYLFKRLKVHRAFDHVRDVLKFFLIIPLCASVSATLGVSSLFGGGVVPAEMVYRTWQVWLVGDMISILTITPFLLVWFAHIPRIRLRQAFEIFVLAVFNFLVCMAAFRGVFGIPIKSSAITYIVFLPIIWAALRFGQRGATLTVLAILVFAIFETIQGYSPFTVGSLNQRLFFLQSFIATISITSLILAAVETERSDLEQRKDEFISVASHELKSPLTSIKVFIQVAKKQLSNTYTTKASLTLGKVEVQTDKLERLISDLLDVSKIQAGKIELHKENIALADLVAETVETTRAITSTHEISFKSLVKKDSLIVYGDRDRISQVLTNLLNNAVKYSPNKKKVLVTLFVKKNDAIVSVKDYGIGMTPKQQEKLFQRYYRVHDHSKNPFPGLGMGLYISSEIIQRHKGKIWLESHPQKGTTFFFSLPIVDKS